jgi:hypothetical protein
MKEITITASAKCYPDIVHHVQIGNRDDGVDISFTFTNADRAATCEESVTEKPRQPVPTPSLFGTSPKLAWVIANSRYGNDWPPLDFVENDRDQMTVTLRRAGFHLLSSTNRSRQQLLADEGVFRQELAQQAWTSVIVYVSGHGAGLDGANYIVPTDSPSSTAIRPADLFALSRIAEDLRPLADGGTFAIVLVDACRSDAGSTPHPLLADDGQGVLMNHSAAPGGVSFDDDNGLSAWTERFIAVADAHPEVGIDQLVLYANRYTKWQSEASLRIQEPILYGNLPARTPPFGMRQSVPSNGILAPI